MLSLEGVSYRYAGAARDSLHAVSLELPDGSLTGLVGADEAGKSSLCLVLGGLAPRVISGDLRGSVRIDGEDVADWPLHRISELVVVGLQDPVGQLSMVAETVYEEVAFGPANLGKPRDEVIDRTERALDLLDIADLTTRDPLRLSGGQQQLVVLAGLLAMRPRHLVLDEPFAHLDGRSTDLVVEALAATAAAGASVLVAEQRSDVLLELCETVAVIAAGNLVRHGHANEVLADPTTLALGVRETAEQRLARLLTEADLGPTQSRVAR